MVYNLVWPFFVGNCHLDRPVGKYLLEAGSWSTIELDMPKEEDAWMVLPRVSGRLVKWGAGDDCSTSMILDGSCAFGLYIVVKLYNATPF